MAYPINTKEEARELRKKGCSLKEISRSFNVAKSTASAWVEDIELSEAAKDRLLQIIKLGQFNSAENKKAQTQILELGYFYDALIEMESKPNYEKIICAMIYWCEGSKNARDGIAFINSDPKLVKKFLNLLRKNFIVDEGRFRACIHIHSYHSPETQLDFWSKITDIDKEQFIRPYQKPNTSKRIRENYQGCISIRYHDNDLARRLMAIAKAFLLHTGA
jgi:hypothetical protein